MSPAQLEVLLKKQRLQFESTRLREQFSHHAGGVVPLCAAADQVGGGLRWLQRRPEIVVGVLVAAVVARPRRIWQLARRSFFVWQGFTRLRALVQKRPTL